MEQGYKERHVICRQSRQKQHQLNCTIVSQIWIFIFPHRWQRRQTLGRSMKRPPLLTWCSRWLWNTNNPHPWTWKALIHIVDMMVNVTTCWPKHPNIEPHSGSIFEPIFIFELHIWTNLETPGSSPSGSRSERSPRPDGQDHDGQHGRRTCWGEQTHGGGAFELWILQEEKN